MAGKQKVYEESMRIAANFIWDHNWPGAVKAYRAALQEFPDDPKALVGLATAYFELEQYESAMRALQRALKKNPANHEALGRMGQVLERLGRLAEAAKTYVYAGNLHAKEGNLDEAITEWERAIRADPDQIQARNNLAHAHARQGRKELAVSEFIAVAAILQDNNQLEKAAEYLHRARQLAPADSFVEAALQALQAGKSIREVQQELAKSTPFEEETALPAADEDLLSFAALAEEEEKAPRSPREQAEQKAMEELANILFEDSANFQGLSMSKPEIDMLIGQAIDWQTRGDIPKAIETYEQIAQAGLKRGAVSFVLASLYLQNGQIEQAIAHFQQAKTEPDYALGVHYALGECYKQQEDSASALKHFVEVLKTIDIQSAPPPRKPEITRLYNELVNRYLREGDSRKIMHFANSVASFLSSRDYRQKIAEARQILFDSDGVSVSAWIEFLETPNTDVVLSAMKRTAEYLRQNLPMTAIETCYQAIEKAPHYLPLHLRLAEIYMRQENLESSINKYLAVAEVYRVRGNLQQVIEIYQKVLKVAPMDVAVRQKLVELYIGQNNIDAAMEEYQILADAYYQLAQVEKSLETYQEALKLSPKASNPKRWQVDLLHRTADIYLQRVDWANAARAYSQIVQLSPEDDKALLSLVDLYYKLAQTDKALSLLDRTTTLLAKQGRLDRILEFLQDMIQLRPQEMPLHERLAALYVKLGMREQAIAQYDHLGELQLEAGLRDDAARTIQQIIALEPENVEGYKQLLAQIKGGI
ncbi:MAG: tetratricopeptide repeat protein [Caldilineae bacterium]|nr:MAG: tetratricopeptide repeat protein [Caldilineae bacterium]